jgi:hypothetical protein
VIAQSVINKPVRAGPSRAAFAMFSTALCVTGEEFQLLVPGQT